MDSVSTFDAVAGCGLGGRSDGERFAASMSRGSQVFLESLGTGSAGTLQTVTD